MQVLELVEKNANQCTQERNLGRNLPFLVNSSIWSRLLSESATQLCWIHWVSTRGRSCYENNPFSLTWRMHWPWLPAWQWGLFSWTQSGVGTRRRLKLFILEIFRVSNAHRSSTPEHVCHLGCHRRGKRLPLTFQRQPSNLGRASTAVLKVHIFPLLTNKNTEDV